MNIRGYLILTVIVILTTLPAAAQAPQPKLYELQSRRAEEVAELLSGFVDAENIRVSDAFNTIAVTATIAEHEVVARLIERFDRPPAELEFQLYILKARAGGNGTPDDIPSDIQSIVREVKALTRYDHFELMDSPVLRTLEGQLGGQLSGEGPFTYELRIRDNTVRRSEDSAEIQVGNFRLEFEMLVGYRQGHRFLSTDEVTEEMRNAPVGPTSTFGPVYKTGALTTSFNIDDGEKIVLGASRIQGSEQQGGLAIVTIVEARVLN